MSTFPMRDLRRTQPTSRRWNRLLWGAAAFFILGTFVYSGTAWLWFRPVLHKTTINRYAGQYKIDPLWVMAIIKVESGFEASARSNRGAVGLMQLLPSTARQLASEVELTDYQDNELESPEINLHLGIYYLSKLQTLFPDDDIAVLSAYNAGPGITREWHRGKPALEWNDIPYGETRRFVRRVDQTYGFLKMVQGWKHVFGIYHGN